MNKKNLTVKDFEDAWGEKVSDFIAGKILESDFEYSEIDTETREKLILETLNHIDSGLYKAGPHRSKDWVKGWAENRDRNSTDFLVPRYFGKFPHVRWKGEFIKTESENFEYNCASVLQYHLFEKFFSTTDNIYEFGCGTGHNLLRAHEVNPTATIHGLDWAESSQHTIERINKSFNKNFKSKKFDFFNVDEQFKIGKNSGVYTFAALEQVGEKHTDFIEYLISQKPSVCLHIEPISELLKPKESLLDFLSVKYFEERNYLNGFYKSLKKLEDNGTIEIVHAQRSNIGSFYVDGYSIVAWRVKCHS